jgi:hypothetical protein
MEWLQWTRLIDIPTFKKNKLFVSTNFASTVDLCAAAETNNCSQEDAHAVLAIFVGLSNWQDVNSMLGGE